MAHPSKLQAEKTRAAQARIWHIHRPVSETVGKATAEITGPLQRASRGPRQTPALAPAAALLPPQDGPGAQDSQVPLRYSLSLEGQQTWWQHPQPYLQLSLSQSTTVPDITLPSLGKPPNSIAGKERSPWMV